jgi:hypothetical protein
MSQMSPGRSAEDGGAEHRVSRIAIGRFSGWENEPGPIEQAIIGRIPIAWTSARLLPSFA